MVRPAMKKPGHRRVSGPITPYTNPKTKPRATRDYGEENFAYDPEYDAEWQMPPSMCKKLSPELDHAAKNWAFSVAALLAALDRMHRMEEEADDRADPMVTHPHLLQSGDFNRFAVVPGAEPTSFSSPVSGTLSFNSAELASSKVPMASQFTQPPANMIGLESPPFTPMSTQGVSTPATGAQGVAPDLHHLSAKLSPLSSQASLSTTSSSGGDRDQKAWESYVKQYNAELYDIQKISSQRVKGYAHEVDKFRVELKTYGKLSSVQEAALHDFTKWWFSIRPQVSPFLAEVAQLQEMKVEGWEDLVALSSKLMQISR